MIVRLILSLILCFIFQIANAQDLVRIPATLNPCQFKIISIDVVKAAAHHADTIPKTGWEKVTLPHNWDIAWKNYTGVAWYKIIWQRHCVSTFDQSQPASFLLDRINMAGAVYSNRELLWHDQSLVEPLSRSWNMPRMWVLPASTLHPHDNEILIKVIGVQSQASGLTKIEFNSVEHISQLHQQYILERRTTYFFNLIITLVLGLTGLFIWLFRRKEYAFGWFALTSLFWVLFISNILMTKPLPFTDTLLTSRLNIIFLLGYVSCLCLFSWRFARKRYKKTEYILFGMSTFLAILLLFVPLQSLKNMLLFCFIYSGLVFFLNCIYFQWIAYKDRRVEILMLAAIFNIFVIIMIHDALIYQSDINAFLWLPFAAPITSLAISCILAWRITQNINQVENFNKKLSRTVEKTTFDLEQSLNKKYQLEVNNMRLQERLNLAHELHDGLGGSISRSMILLDLNENVDKTQIMSILKLLRNDLRQVIDSGSSLGSKVPENPVLWAAPIRHRFVQIFEEMDIHSIWHMPPQWISIPSMIQSLTLARVAEEALNNIVKHSQATEVKVSLYENEQDILILEIQDNGIGFDPTTVQQGFHVGLQSMQVRVKRLGGDFEMQSRQGETIIRASLHL
ncbi:ATP-binding protein [Acinetobacter sp. Marseille-Q1618]|uniref:sensor histidine kinase n=1 Tax=Acinetobacter sp. Marseille-Q1618 TaxID=2697502 RepID=UPI0020C4B931|nr:ATP-binding protein [Acinetobacter sp. Marseille-Q1618]